jgi:drug/metabolite transporter (DMT)-like permease
MVASNMALRHVNYPTQVIGKSCKPIPVMVLGVLFARKSYPLRKYMFILTIIAGVALFMWKDGKSSAEDGNIFGYSLLMLSLAMDGLTGAIQDRIRAESDVRFAPLMYNINLWASLMLCTTTLATGELAVFVDFVSRYPIVMQEIIWFSVLSAFGQVRIL